ncbi:hypothetical protein A8139_09430 [Marinomonas primoryensis]|uniref:DUF1127 domain-containing protein n=1 Tax=Marinomonas primoryensis TaxID=178399 RepID=A0A2Z4PRM0_9GAMM|nr:DUF1127 domain-containing protein [Marinomonas primoryensis]AWY00192.1 hypothetical protein A8139_09430 [Marinomonas primoryensis]
MLIVSLFVHFQDCVTRYQTRKGLASLTAQQLMDIGMTKERQQAELSQASFKGILCDMMVKVKKRGRML